MSKPIRRLAPAKLNLFLHIIAQRANGYHDLQTLFQLINLHDELTFTTNDQNLITRTDGLSDVPPQDDLAVRAAYLLKTKYSQRYGDNHLGVTISIDKRIPAGGGLGGGSSDAATTLLTLNELWRCGFTITELATFGLTLGADVPVFIHQQHAFAEGVGEHLQPLTAAEHIGALPKAFVLITPNVHVSTAWVFQHAALPRNTPKQSLDELLARQQKQNDCELLVCQHFPAVQHALDLLRQHGEAAMTGTGATVFLPCDSLVQARRIHSSIAKQLPKPWRSWAIASL